jgi:minor curlin subunit
MKISGIAIFLSICINISAQENIQFENDLLRDINHTLTGSINGQENEIVTNQVGNSNTGIINQFQAQYGNLGNYANIYQDGDFNSAILYQFGSQISTSLIQTGSENYADIKISGQNINGDISQEGYSNYIQQDIGGNDFNYFIIQEGNNNEFIQNATGVNMDFGISQIGDGITIIIE